MRSIIWELPDELFINIVEESNSYLEVARKVGHFGSSGGKLAKTRIESLGLHFKTKVDRTVIPDDDIFRKAKNKPSNLRERFLKLNIVPYECAICHQGSKWNGVELTLHLDHIDGDTTNNETVNLRWLCPNCHTQTETYSGRNNRVYHTSRTYGKGTCIICSTCFDRKSRGAKTCSRECLLETKRKPIPIDRQELELLLKENSFSYVGKLYNVSDNSVRKWCKRYGLPTNASSYK